jgi:virulence-associated protein VapD
MYAISFDLDLATVTAIHPKGFQQAYRDVERALADHGFHRVQQSVYVADEGGLGRLLDALDALKALSWFPKAVTDIRAFRVEDWSDVTAQIKGRP